jgi:peptidoglycan/LPS O-acetylase OafA/YrhL
VGEKHADEGRLRGIEGLRALAAVSVLLFHVHRYAAPDGQPANLGPLNQIFENLRAGVTLFFVLSGFLLYRVFAAAALRGRPMPSVRRYLRNRALRIMPAYWVILIAVSIVFQRQLLGRPLELLANLLLVQNYVPSYTIGGAEGVGIVPAWSLVVEVSFYLVLPVLGYIAVRRARGGHAITAAFVPVIAMFVLGLGAKAWARTMDESDSLTVWNYALPTHADWFAAGMAVAVALVLHEDGRLPLRRSWLGAAAVAAAIFAAASVKLHNGGELNPLEQQTPNAVFFALVLAFVVLSSSETRTVRWLSLRPIVFLGLASYSLFLVHDPIIRGFREWGLTFGGTAGFGLNVALIGGVAVACASISYLCVERPVLARRRSWHAADQSGLGSDAPGGGVETSGSRPPIAAIAARSN